MNRDKRGDWREICEKVLEEKNPERLNDLLEELLDALEQRSRQRGSGPQP